MTLEFVVLTLASAQSFLLGVLIFQKHGALYANRFLALMMFACGIATMHILLQDNGVYGAAPALLYLVLGIPFLVGPLHFLYAKYILTGSPKITRNDWLHFLPAAVIESIAIPIAVASPAILSLPHVNDVARVPAAFHVYNWLLLTCGLTYTIVTLSMLLRYGRVTKNIASSLENVRLNWLMFLTLAALAVWVEFLAESVLLAFGMNLSNFIVTSICGGLYVYAIGYYGLLKSEVLSEPATQSTMHEIFVAASTDSRPAGKYEKSGLSERDAAQIAGSLVELMERDKPYRRASLTIKDLASMLAVTPHNLSEVINTRFGKNFYDFINGYRVEHAKRDLSDPSRKNLKILSIAFDAGFNSKASFNSVFKAITNVTPSEFRRNASGPDE